MSEGLKRSMAIDLLVPISFLGLSLANFGVLLPALAVALHPPQRTKRFCKRSQSKMDQYAAVADIHARTNTLVL